MGNLCCGKRKQRKNIVLLLLGLDNAGKTVAVKNLAGEPVDTVIPTVGFSVVHLQHGHYNIQVYDLGGRPDFRDVWERYYVDAHGIIFVVDASDYDRLSEANRVLSKIISNEKVHGKPLLLLANKQDNENALDEIDIIEKFQLEFIVNEAECPTLVESCSASENIGNPIQINTSDKPDQAKTKNGPKIDMGIKRGYNWIVNYIIREYTSINERVEKDVKVQQELDRKEREEKIARLRQLQSNELESECQNDGGLDKMKTNGFDVRDVYVIRNNKCKHSDSDSSQSEQDIVYHGTIQNEFVSEQQRPKSATSLIRKQLELDGVQKKKLKFGSNKTTPVHLFNGGGRIMRVKSAGNNAKESGEKNKRILKSAGDSVFVVSNELSLAKSNHPSSEINNQEQNSQALKRTTNQGIKQARFKNGGHTQTVNLNEILKSDDQTFFRGDLNTSGEVSKNGGSRLSENGGITGKVKNMRDWVDFEFSAKSVLPPIDTNMSVVKKTFLPNGVQDDETIHDTYF